jgi:hypothetical protein
MSTIWSGEHGLGDSTLRRDRLRVGGVAGVGAGDRWGRGGWRGPPWSSSGEVGVSGRKGIADARGDGKS